MVKRLPFKAELSKLLLSVGDEAFVGRALLDRLLFEPGFVLAGLTSQLGDLIESLLPGVVGCHAHDRQIVLERGARLCFSSEPRLEVRLIARGRCLVRDGALVRELTRSLDIGEPLFERCSVLCGCCTRRDKLGVSLGEARGRGDGFRRAILLGLLQRCAGGQQLAFDRIARRGDLRHPRVVLRLAFRQVGRRRLQLRAMPLFRLVMSGFRVGELLIDDGARLGFSSESILDIGQALDGDRAIIRGALVRQLTGGRTTGELLLERGAGLFEFRARVDFFCEPRGNGRQALCGSLLVGCCAPVRQLTGSYSLGQLLLEQGAGLFEPCAGLCFVSQLRFDVRQVLRGRREFIRCAFVGELADGCGLGQLLVQRGTGLFKPCAGFGFLSQARFDVRQMLRRGCEFSRCALVGKLPGGCGVSQLLFERCAGLFESCAGLGFLSQARFDVRQMLRRSCEFSRCALVGKLSGGCGVNQLLFERCAGLFESCAGLGFLSQARFDVRQMLRRRREFGRRALVGDLPRGFGVREPLLERGPGLGCLREQRTELGLAQYQIIGRGGSVRGVSLRRFFEPSRRIAQPVRECVPRPRHVRDPGGELRLPSRQIVGGRCGVRRAELLGLLQRQLRLRQTPLERLARRRDFFESCFEPFLSLGQVCRRRDQFGRVAVGGFLVRRFRVREPLLEGDARVCFSSEPRFDV